MIGLSWRLERNGVSWQISGGNFRVSSKSSGLPRNSIDRKDAGAEVARSLDLPPNLLYGWVRQFKSRAKEAFWENRNSSSQDEELRKLRRDLAAGYLRAACEGDRCWRFTMTLEV
jgi:hypothetical protein